jgi:hypothetical protein
MGGGYDAQRLLRASGETITKASIMMEEGGYLVPEEFTTPVCIACGNNLPDRKENMCETCRSTQGGGYYGDEANTY